MAPRALSLIGEDRGHEAVGLPRVEQEQQDACPDDEVDEPEDEDHDAAGHLGAAGTRTWRCAGWSVRTSPVATGSEVGGGQRLLGGDDRPVDLVDGHGVLPCTRHPGKRGLATTAG